MLEKAPNQLLQAIKLKVPAGIECDACVLQWTYVTSNSPWSYPEASIQPALPPQPARLPAAPTPTALEPAATVATGLLELRRHRNHGGRRDALTLALAFTLSIALSGIAVAIAVTISEPLSICISEPLSVSICISEPLSIAVQRLPRGLPWHSLPKSFGQGLLGLRRRHVPRRHQPMRWVGACALTESGTSAVAKPHLILRQLLGGRQPWAREVHPVQRKHALPERPSVLGLLRLQAKPRRRQPNPVRRDARLLAALQERGRGPRVPDFLSVTGVQTDRALSALRGGPQCCRRGNRWRADLVHRRQPAPRHYLRLVPSIRLYHTSHKPHSPEQALPIPHPHSGEERGYWTCPGPDTDIACPAFEVGISCADFDQVCANWCGRCLDHDITHHTLCQLGSAQSPPGQRARDL